MKTSVVAAMKQRAAENFKLKDVSFVDFDSIDIDELSTVDPKNVADFSASVEVSANLCLTYDGTPPESYRVLNSMIQDWVEDHDADLKKIINPKLLPFIKERYKDIDASDLSEDFDDYVWEDQVDYMPELDEESKTIKFMVELVLEVEETESDD
jgi:hypothetical protein